MLPKIRCCNMCEIIKNIDEFRNTGHNDGNRRHVCYVCELMKNRIKKEENKNKPKIKCESCYNFYNKCPKKGFYTYKKPHLITNFHMKALSPVISV